jgi:predicted ribosomally synthesized peptide with nif11-like leader
MTNLTPELIAKAKAAKSSEDLIVLAKANHIELTEDEAKTYWAQLNENGAISDEELDLVAGGCGTDGEEEKEKNKALPAGMRICPACKTSVPMNIRKCPSCQKLLNARV